MVNAIVIKGLNCFADNETDATEDLNYGHQPRNGFDFNQKHFR